MRKIIITSLALSVLAAHSASAKNLGVLSSDKKPQKLVQSSEFLNYMKEHHSDTQDVQTPQANNHDSNFWGGWGWGGWGGWGSFFPYYYYPFYSGFYWSNERGAEDHSQAAASAVSGNDLGQTPVVCFASNAAGNWFANTDIAQNIVAVQQASNTECDSSSVSCTQNLGCALVQTR